MATAPKRPRRSESRRDRALARALDSELSRLGRRLRELRHEREWTLEQAAERALLHTVTLSRIETGQSNVTVATLVSLSKTYGVDLASLFAR